MARRMLWIACVAGALALAVGAGVASGRISDIFSSPHDLGSPGNPTCRQCHTPHNAEGLYLWARSPASGQSGIAALCLSCHDGSVTNVGWYIRDPNYVSHVTEAGSKDRDCDQCHNAHEGDNWVFLRDYTSTGVPMIQNANVCLTCHRADEGPEGLSIGRYSHPVDQSTDTPADRQRDPDAIPPDLTGARLWDSSGRHVVNSGPAEVKCETCHASHGAQPGTIPFSSMDGTPREIQTLSTIPYSATKYSPLCENCHR
ncbi:MAG: cytochrome c3 family protein [Chloroflexi bacterium]|nr:cytochrome c3 family protein [Chloroflexota bacterium]